MFNYRISNKLLSLATVLLFIQGCATSEPVKLSYSSEFSLTMPVSDLSGAVVFSSDELALKTRDGQLLSGRVISTATEGLPAEFAMPDYPKFIFGLEPLETLAPSEARLFSNSANEIRHSFGNEIDQENVDEFTTYTVCGTSSCLAYVTKEGFNDHILSVHGSGISREEFTSLINGGLDANP